MNWLFSGLDAALFDLDGTLVETNIDFPLMRREMVRLARARGVEEPNLENLDILAIVDRLTEHLRRTDGGEAADAARDQAFAILEEIELRHSAEATEIHPARELIQAMQGRRIRVGIVTRNCRRASQDSLARVGIAPDALVCREDVVRAKPCPDHLLVALERLSAEPQRAVMIGDHLMDVVAGKAAGMRTIGLLTPGRPPDYFAPAEPDAVAQDLSEILCAFIHCDSQLEH